MKRTYGPLLRTLNLVPEEQEVLIDLLAEYQTIVMDLARRHHSDAATLERERKHLNDQLHTNIATLLGTAKFSLFIAFTRALAHSDP